MLELSAFSLADLLPFIAIGFVAQIIDGALGMAFGVIASTLLVSTGVPPASASAGVHMIKNFTGAASAISHILHRNVEWRLFLRILLPGVIGGIAGAWLLTRLSAEAARPAVLVYLTLIGLFLLWRGATHRHVEREPKVVEPIGALGGFLDAAGGGGWGPVVTSNLLVQGASPRKVVGTVNTAEFFLALAITATFAATMGIEAFTIATAGLLIGGVLAAPFGAWAAKRIKADLLLTLVGIVLTATSLYGLYRALS